MHVAGIKQYLTLVEDSEVNGEETSITDVFQLGQNTMQGDQSSSSSEDSDDPKDPEHAQILFSVSKHDIIGIHAPVETQISRLRLGDRSMRTPHTNHVCVYANLQACDMYIYIYAYGSHAFM